MLSLPPMENKNTGNPAPEKPGDDGSFQVRIEKLVTGGAGLGRHEGQAVFVPRTAPGDLADVRVVEARKGFLRAEVVAILENGSDRREAPCPHYGECGGCDLQHLGEDAQRKGKAEIVLDCFQRLGKLDVSGLLSGPRPGGELGYRNRIRLFSSPTGRYGLMRRGTHDVVELDACPLMPERFNGEILPWLRFLPPVDQIVVRMDGREDERSRWILSIFGQPPRLKVLKKIISALGPGEAPAPGCAGILFNNLPVWGRDYLLYTVAGHTLRAGVHSFFQGNLAVTEQAVALARDWIAELRDKGSLGPLLGDLFCGVGLFTLTLADLFEKIVAIDSDQPACRDAINNIARDDAARGKATVHTGPLAQVMGQVDLASPAEWSSSLCLVDPPRTGLGKEGVDALLKADPRHILYMSCDPATLARDVGRLHAAGYAPRRLEVLDMFPQTAHIESLLLLERDAQ
ncbi:MAG: class I SAM-dependent RNA methyltransferase [bacterium]